VDDVVLFDMSLRPIYVSPPSPASRYTLEAMSRQPRRFTGPRRAALRR
jgi:hypothetical protein